MRLKELKLFRVVFCGKNIYNSLLIKKTLSILFYRSDFIVKFCICQKVTKKCIQVSLTLKNVNVVKAGFKVV